MTEHLHINHEGISPKETGIQSFLLQNYPGLHFDRMLLVNNMQTRLAIDDISYFANTPIGDGIALLAQSCKGSLEVYDAQNLTLSLAEKLAPLYEDINPERILTIFPGNGSQIILKLLPEKFKKEYLEKGSVAIISAQRRVNSLTGFVESVDVNEASLPKNIAKENIVAVVVLDDVIVTGTTITAVRGALLGEQVAWFAGSLMTLSPIQNRRRTANSPSGVKDYSSITSPLIYQGTDGIPALNSLSTLIEDSEKSNMIRERYMGKYVHDSANFLLAVRQLQQTFL